MKARVRERWLFGGGLLVLGLAAALGAATLLIPIRATLPLRSLRWTSKPLPELGAAEHWQTRHATVATLHEAERPLVVIGEAARSLELEHLEGLAVTDFFYDADAGVAVAVADLVTEGAGPTLELLISTDDGAQWVQRTLRKPSWQASVEALRIDWPVLRVQLRLDEGGTIDPRWLRWPRRLVTEVWPLEGASGDYLAESRDGAQTFLLTPP
jgi:hypothetical protein